MVLISFLTCQLNGGIHCLTFLELVFFADKTKIQGVTFM